MNNIGRSVHSVHFVPGQWIIKRYNWSIGPRRLGWIFGTELLASLHRGGTSTIDNDGDNDQENKKKGFTFVLYIVFVFSWTTANKSRYQIEWDSYFRFASLFAEPVNALTTSSSTSSSKSIYFKTVSLASLSNVGMRHIDVTLIHIVAHTQNLIQQ